MNNLLRLVFLSLVLCSADSYAEFDSGNLLAKNCAFGEASDEAINYYANGQCSGVITGTVDAIDYYQSLGENPELICVPDGVTRGQAKKVVQKYMEDNPAQLHYTATLVIWAALREAFPCED